MGTCAEGGSQPPAFRAFVRSITSNNFHCIIMKLCENVCWQNISAKFDNQSDPIKHFGVMALELAKNSKINRVRSGSSSN